MQSNEEREMLIRHDEQLKALPELAKAVNRLTTALEVANARTSIVSGVVGVIGSTLACVGTWIIMAWTGHTK
jgi:hypothetical protein